MCICRSGVEEETKKKLKPSVSTANGFGDCIFIDEEEATLDHPMPMLLEKSYTSITEVDSMVTKNYSKC